MLSNFHLPPIQQIKSFIAQRANIEIHVLRLDLIHPYINGNKWFKLKYNLLAAEAQRNTTILTFGGAYSNHIFATAAAGNLFGLRTIGVIRGEERLPLNATLQFAVSQQMELVYLDRKTYRQRATVELHEQLKERFGEVFIIPEGGANLYGVQGCTEILQELPGVEEFNIICVPCGTATTLVGLALSLHQQQMVMGFPVLKGGEFLVDECDRLGKNYLANHKFSSGRFLAPWKLVCNYHFGGYGKVKPALMAFCQKFADEHGIPLDYIYTGKMFYGIMDLLQKGFFSSGSRLLLIHTGGLQGNTGIDSTCLQESFWLSYGNFDHELRSYTWC